MKEIWRVHMRVSVPHLKLCGLRCSWDDIRAKAPVREEDVTCFCVAVPTCARPRTHTAKPPPPPSKSPSPPTRPPSAIRTHNPCPASTPPTRPNHLHAHRVPHAQQLRRRERLLAQSSFRNSTSVAPDLDAVASLACHGTGLPTTADPWHVSDATLTPVGAASAQSDSLHATARKNATVVPGAWSSVRSVHTCGKAVSTSALVDAPRTPACTQHPCTGRGRGKGRRRRRRRRRRRPVKRRAQPAAVLLHILTEQVEPDFRRSDIRVTFDFERPRLSKAEQASQQKARSIPSEDLEDMIDYAELEENSTSKNPEIYVHTFTGEDIWCLVKVHDFPSIDNDEIHSAIISCECPEFTKHELKCKHMFLASRITGYPIQLLVSAVSTQAIVQFPPTNGLPSDAVALEKQATIQRIREQVSSIARLSEGLAAMDLGGIDRATLVGVETMATRLRRDLSAAISNRPMYATQRN
ncbi:hypothetical protein B0H14DRAFT_3634603 [Mycena olivaceomarginata]|nr:hypothetical protein B0H14DRAFT_3634603 [Mycena olivaceomarginata]